MLLFNAEFKKGMEATDLDELLAGSHSSRPGRPDVRGTLLFIVNDSRLPELFRVISGLIESMGRRFCSVSSFLPPGSTRRQERWYVNVAGGQKNATYWLRLHSCPFKEALFRHNLSFVRQDRQFFS